MERGRGRVLTSAADRLAVDGGTPVRTRPLSLGKGVALLGEEERNAALEVLESRSLFRYYGPDFRHRVADFEEAVRDALGARHAVATSSGTAALRTALAALGVGCGDEVVLPAFTFIATVNAVVVAGAVPVFAEIDDTLNIDPDDALARVTEKTAAVVPVHLENTACDLDPLLAGTQAAGIPVIEDAAQSMGATYHGRSLGTIGDMGCFSLQLEKNVTSGEGGVVTTDDETLFLRAARYQDQGGQFVTQHAGGRGEEVDDPFVGENLRMTEIAGAIAEVQLRRLPELLAALRANRSRVLADLGEFAGMTLRRSPDPAGDGASSITWFLPDAELARGAMKAMRAEGLPCAQMYRGQPVYATPSILAKRTASGKGGPWNCAEHPTTVEYRIGMCPRTEDLAFRSLTLGIGPAWTDADCDDVITAVTKVAGALLR